MFSRVRAIAWTVAGGALVFAGVQDSVAVAGARRYVALQRAALASGRQPVTIDEVMSEAVRRSVRDGLLWACAVLVAGAGAATISRRTLRE